MRALIAQFARFGVVGLGGLVIDVAIFNILRTTVMAPEVFHEGPVVAKVISTTVAIIANWLGNRYWTFGSRRRPHMVREGVEFAIVSVGGMLIGLGCLWVSHYVLGFTSVLADNIATNVVGLALGTAFRFTFYRIWVFRQPAPPVILMPSDAGGTGTAAAAGKPISTIAPVDEG